ncbi:HD-GYP domain-containing protein [Cohnella thailandensis]|uniref:HD domain-containing protein n=1 Tax=Cohnella thailandensis TaxID=557557 RepID=A0A841SZH5_9BACL|nr:HD domain-containing phosphohydrolase [Cohnella thailandensis]MBB6635037.1 HD domain-containing protein [Cohnella thailandensis]MBP1975739.1 putative nucleotidyltransferase with HDIG domain [Cohnella thailandensis]
MRKSLSSGLRTLGRSLDSVTFSHSLRVGLLAQAMSEPLRMSDEDRQKFTLACCFHDIGKLGIPDSILLKSAPLDPSEKIRLRAHPLFGLEFIRKLGWSDRRMLDTIRSHHERWDGTGYPDGLSGRRIPSWARMCAVIDAFDAMVQPRSYNSVKSLKEAKEELDAQRDVQFDGRYVDLFLALPDSTVERIQSIQ